MTFATPDHAVAATRSLRFDRLRTAAADLPPGSLGGRELGADGDGPRLLWPPGPVTDAWSGLPAPPLRRQASVHFTTDGDWLHGCAEIDDAVVPGGLQAAAQQIYHDLFEVLATHRCPALLRLWNYVPRITEDDGGGERYWQFNAGRQKAFIDAQRSVLDGAPAASALGIATGPLRVYFLAGRRAPLAIENPRQVSAYRYPERYGPRSPTFSRAAHTDLGEDMQALFISGTASIVGHATTHVGDVRGQVVETLHNIDALRAEAMRCTGTEFPLERMFHTIYLRREADLAVVREVFEHRVGCASPAAQGALYVRADVCRADLLVEIEVHGFAAPHRAP